MTSTRQKPCPWCNGTQIIHIRGEIGNLHWMQCKACKAEGPVGMCQEEAKELWNTRSKTTEKGVPNATR